MLVLQIIKLELELAEKGDRNINSFAKISKKYQLIVKVEHLVKC
jgi:hypothetical protein